MSVAEPLSVHHLAVLVADLDRAEAFYSGVLGLPVRQRHRDDAGAPRSVWVGLGGAGFLALERAGTAGPRRGEAAPGWHCVALAIPAAARAAWRARLLAAGVAVERESRFSLYARDPDGNLVALSHHPCAADEGK
jgi:glyoxylase I family protein